jgi:hypothetical protein
MVMTNWHDEFKARLKQAQRYLQDAEDIARQNGVQVPLQQPELADHEKIQFPRGYIRRADEFRGRYELRRIISDDDLCSNIAYALQTTDFLNYLLNRFSIGLSVGRVLYKMAIVHVFSIIEALIFGVIDSVHSNCVEDGDVCRRSDRCEFYVRGPGKYSFRDAVELLMQKAVLPLSEAERDRLLTLKAIRDRVHIWGSDGNEFIDHNYSLPEYNLCIVMLNTIREHLIDNFSCLEASIALGCPKHRV